jgi:heme-degrading monooxygenase HmoA
MFARVTRIEASPDALDQGVALFERDLLPQVKHLPGFVGAAVLHNRDNRRGATVTYWASEEAMRGSEQAASATRAQGTQTGGTIADVERYELVIVERTAPPQANVFVRSNELLGAADKLDATIAWVRDKVWPVVRAQQGFRALLMGVNRQNGRSLVSSIWDTAADREASDAALRDLRREGGQVSGAGEARVELYEVAFVDMGQLLATT